MSVQDLETNAMVQAAEEAAEAIVAPALPWGLPAPQLLRQRDEQTVAQVDLRLVCEAWSARAQADLLALAGELEMAGECGRTVQVTAYDAKLAALLPRPLTATERQVLGHSEQAYLVQMDQSGGFVVAGGYAGAVHALERLRQWRELPAAARHPFTMLDLPRLAVRGMNRDDAEDWSLSYWQSTIRFARGCFMNLLGLSAEQAVEAFACGDEPGYRQLVERFATIREQARRSGIRLAPMIYNVDHMLGQFLKAARREDLTRVRDRIIIRHDLPEAWDVALELMGQVMVDLAPPAIVLWASEAAHALHGDALGARAQWTSEARFYARLIQRVRTQCPQTRLLAILSQGVRDEVQVFTEILADLPVELVHYDGEWTYNAQPEALTTWAVTRSLEAGHRWVGKGAWSRVAYNGIPLAQPAKVRREALELIERGYCGIFPNATRWATNPWNARIGAAAAWGGDRCALETMVQQLLDFEGESRFSVPEVLELEAIWTRLNLLNTPGEGAPRLSAHRSLLYHMMLWVERAARDEQFAVSPFEEAHFWKTWQTNAPWLAETRRQVTTWRQRLDNRPDDENRLFPASLAALLPMLDLYMDALAAAFIVCREASPDNTRGPWQAWRRLLGKHLVGARQALERLLAFAPVDHLSSEAKKYEGRLFADSADLAPLYQWGPPLRRMMVAADAVLDRLEDEKAFAGLAAQVGLAGYWPRDGLYSVLDWPMRLPPQEAAARMEQGER